MAACTALTTGMVLYATAVHKPAPVQLIRVPEGGIQPQAVTDAKGIVHVIYFNGNPSAGDIYYVRSTDTGRTFSKPIRVNSEPGSAIAVGNIRGARVALGRSGIVHVAWNGSASATPNAGNNKPPMLYTRLNTAGTAFERQRNLIHSAWGIDGGGSVAADRAGRVYVFWHAPIPGKQGEANRRVWIATSNDDGKTFAPERVAWDKPTGACGCCGLDAFADHNGTLFVVFRSAEQMVHRDMNLLVSRDRGASFQGSDISKWNVGYCVMSSESLTESKAGVLGAWETEKQVYFGRMNPASGALTETIGAPGAGNNRKYPSIAGNNRGQILLAWTEGMGW
ncbi:MAG: hypothetical protein ACRD5Z_25075, partial [Bryobacteraceae bacterium]